MVFMFETPSPYNAIYEKPSCFNARTLFNAASKTGSFLSRDRSPEIKELQFRRKADLSSGV